MPIVSSSSKKFNPNSVVGVDISKSTLEVAFSYDSNTETYANDDNGIKKLVREIKKIRPRLVLMESTGRYGRKLISGLDRSKVPYKLENPKRIRDFSKACGKMEKTDKIDAKMISFAGEKLDLQPSRYQIDVDILEIKDSISVRNILKKSHTQVSNELTLIENKFLRKTLENVIKEYENSIKKIDEEIMKIISSRDDLMHKYEVLTSVPGVGYVTAIVVIGHCPELGSIERNQLAKLAGLAPIAQDSGTKKGVRTIQGGRQILRNALFMAAISGSAHNAKIKQFYENLTSRNKPKKIAIIACMRKLLILLNAMMKHNKTWLEFCANVKEQ